MKIFTAVLLSGVMALSVCSCSVKKGVEDMKNDYYNTERNRATDDYYYYNSEGVKVYPYRNSTENNAQDMTELTPTSPNTDPNTAPDIAGYNN